MKIDMKYFVAYKDENGKDYNGQPWIIPEDGYDDKDFAKMVKNDMIKRGFKNVILFECKNVPENVDWDFVEDNEL
jgi:hypothetical protein